VTGRASGAYDLSTDYFPGVVRWPIASVSVLFAFMLLTQGAVAATTPKGAKAVYRDGPSSRLPLGGTWFERHDPQDQGLRQRLQTSKNLSGWTRTSVPSAANAGDFSEPSYVGTVYWYRKDFKLPRSESGAKWLFRFESVNYRAKVWLNGHPLGVHVGAYLPFEMRAKGIRPGRVNRLVVRVDSRRQKFDIPPLSVRTNGQFEGGWWNYNGILREVYLRKVVNLDMATAFVTPRLGCRTCAATVRIDARVENLTRHGRRARVVGTFGGRGLRFKAHRVPGHGSRKFKARLRVRNPRLWEPGHPSLYSVRLWVIDEGGRVVQQYRVHVGIRSLKVNRLGRIVLNGREVNLRGAAIHEDSLSRGGALSPAQMRQTFQNLHDLGATITRQHYPLSPYELELADRYGIMVWSEIPVFRMKSTLFNVAEIRHKGLRMLRQEVTRDYNHPSVMVWSIGNENASRPKRGLQSYIRRAARTVRDMDPTRLIGIATSGFPTVEKQDVYLDLDVIGVNDYFGWYNGPRGSIADRAALDGYLNRLHSDYPNQAFVITEVGAEANRHGPVTEKGTYEFQSDFLSYHFGIINSKPFINAAIIWALHDFRVKPGWAGGNPFPHPPVNEKGLVDDRGFRKPAFAVVQKIFHATGPFR
jgi:beta-galactosidase/beta-glucuronidase